MQVFVANPNKPQPIVDILANNRDKLLKFLEEFHTEKGGDPYRYSMHGQDLYWASQQQWEAWWEAIVS